MIIKRELETIFAIKIILIICNAVAFLGACMLFYKSATQSSVKLALDKITQADNWTIKNGLIKTTDSIWLNIFTWILLVVVSLANAYVLYLNGWWIMSIIILADIIISILIDLAEHIFKFNFGLNHYIVKAYITLNEADIKRALILVCSCDLVYLLFLILIVIGLCA